jgi:hypothetical protein
MSSPGLMTFAAIFCLALGAHAGWAQELEPAPPKRPGSSANSLPRPILAQGPDQASDASVLLSLALPGAGQYRSGQTRAWAYVAVEAAAWVLFLDRRAAGQDFKRRYRDYAWNTSRFHTTSRQEGDWAYYEALTKWGRSGLYDRNDALGGTQPELDPATFNGAVWALAREIYFPAGQSVSEGDVAYQQALSYYQSQAYGPAFLWDWGATPGAQQEYGRLIDRSDQGFRQATIALGAVVANHLVSAADAYLSARGRRELSHLSFAPDVRPWGTRWTAEVRLPVPR